MSLNTFMSYGGFENVGEHITMRQKDNKPVQWYEQDEIIPIYFDTLPMSEDDLEREYLPVPENIVLNVKVIGYQVPSNRVENEIIIEDVPSFSDDESN